MIHAKEGECGNQLAGGHRMGVGVKDKVNVLEPNSMLMSSLGVLVLWGWQVAGSQDTTGARDRDTQHHPAG